MGENRGRTAVLDQFDRKIDYLRISLTDRCNLRCVYCMPEEGVEWQPHDAILSYEEIARLVRLFADLGIRRVRLTGGEPLVRRGVAELIAAIKAIPGIEAVYLTTNGLALQEQLPGLLAAGLDGVNISLDTLDRAQYAAITRRDALPQALAGLEAALAAPGLTVKLNCVPMGRNDNQLPALSELARDRDVSVRFIELMPIGLGKTLSRRTEAEVLAILEPALGPWRPCAAPPGAGPAHYGSFPGFRGTVGFISAMTHSFCENCNRARLTSTGFLKTCLQYETGVNLKALMDRGADDAALLDAMERAIRQKPAHHHFSTPSAAGDESHSMFQIGG